MSKLPCELGPCSFFWIETLFRKQPFFSRTSSFFQPSFLISLLLFKETLLLFSQPSFLKKLFRMVRMVQSRPTRLQWFICRDPLKIEESRWSLLLAGGHTHAQHLPRDFFWVPKTTRSRRWACLPSTSPVRNTLARWLTAFDCPNSDMVYIYILKLYVYINELYIYINRILYKWLVVEPKPLEKNNRNWNFPLSEGMNRKCSGF